MRGIRHDWELIHELFWKLYSNQNQNNTRLICEEYEKITGDYISASACLNIIRPLKKTQRFEDLLNEKLPEEEQVWYAMYRGDDFLEMGTLSDMAEKFNMTESRIKLISTPSYHRLRGNNLISVKVEPLIEN